MTNIERAELQILLNDLLSAQDAVTHLNEKGPSAEAETIIARLRRNTIRGRIMVFAESLCSRRGPACVSRASVEP